MPTSTYSQYVYPDKIVSPINGYTRKRITKANISKFGFNSIEELHERYPGFPLDCDNTLSQYQNKSKEYADTVRYNAEQSYSHSISKCVHCRNDLPFAKRSNRFCSKSCSASYNNRLRGPMPTEIRTQIGNALKAFNKANPDTRRVRRTDVIYGPKSCAVILLQCKCCSKSFYARKADSWRATCSPECARKNSTYRKIVIEYKHDGETLLLESSWELEIAEWLDSMNITWTRPKHIPWIDSIGKARKYFPDFYLPDYDLYLDPKNPYIMQKDKEKLETVTKLVSLLYGNVEYIKHEVLSVLDALDPRGGSAPPTS